MPVRLAVQLLPTIRILPTLSVVPALAGLPRLPAPKQVVHPVLVGLPTKPVEVRYSLSCFHRRVMPASRIPRQPESDVRVIPKLSPLAAGFRPLAAGFRLPASGPVPNLLSPIQVVRQIEALHTGQAARRENPRLFIRLSTIFHVSSTTNPTGHCPRGTKLPSSRQDCWVTLAALWSLQQRPRALVPAPAVGFARGSWVPRSRPSGFSGPSLLHRFRCRAHSPPHHRQGPRSAARARSASFRWPAASPPST